MTISETTKLIASYHPTVRIGGYLRVSGALAELGAKLRTRTNGDDFSWTKEEQAEWDRLSDEYEPYFYALTEEEKKLLEFLEPFFADITCGELPKKDD